MCWFLVVLVVFVVVFCFFCMIWSYIIIFSPPEHRKHHLNLKWGDLIFWFRPTSCTHFATFQHMCWDILVDNSFVSVFLINSHLSSWQQTCVFISLFLASLPTIIFGFETTVKYVSCICTAQLTYSPFVVSAGSKTFSHRSKNFIIVDHKIT